MIEMLTFPSREAWLKERWRIGGSECSAILGMNPYKTNVDLWEEKTGLVVPADISGKPYVQYGTYAEYHLRELFRLDFPQYAVEYVENNMWVNDIYPFAHASLDGWLTDEDGRKGVLEVKTTNVMASIQKERWTDKVPDNYYCQALWNLGVTEFDFLILKAQLRYEGAKGVYLQTRHYHIERSEVQSDIDYLFGKGSEFWEYVKARKKPPLVLPPL